MAGWSTSANVPGATRELAKTLGCPTRDSRALKKCLKSKNFEEFIQAVEKSVRRFFSRTSAKTDLKGAVGREIAFGKFVPRIDGEFIPKDYEELLHDAPPKPTVMGFTDSEAIFFGTLERERDVSGGKF